MTDAEARRIGELVRELGDLMRSVSTVPTVEQSRLIRLECTARDAGAALNLVTCIMAETAGRGMDPLALADAIHTLSGVLATMHKDSRKREVTPADVMRILATNFESRDKASSAVDRLISLMLAPSKAGTGSN